MDHTKFRQALSGLLNQQPHLRSRFEEALRRDERQQRKAALDRNYMVWQSLKKLEELAPRVLEMVRLNPEDVDPWHEHKINVAAEYLDAVLDSLTCRAEHEVPPYASSCEEDEEGDDADLDGEESFDVPDEEMLEDTGL